jgi:hypothetical protein
MRRTIFVVLGVLEILSAAVLFAFVWQLPGPGDVHDRVGRVERLSRQTSSQVRKLRQQVHLLRDQQPQARQFAENVRVQLHNLSEQLQKQQIDYPAVQAVHDAFGMAAGTLDNLSVDRMAPEGFAQIGLALGVTAEFLDVMLVPDVARLLRAGRDGLGEVLARGPELRQSLRDSATLVREMQSRLKMALDNRSTYDASVQQSRTLLEGFSAAVPMYTAQWGKDLADSENSLTNLGQSIDDVSAVMPEVKTSGARLMVMTRLLLSLLGAIFLLHGGYLAVNSWMGQAAARRAEGPSALA